MGRVIFSALRHAMDKERAFKLHETEVKYVHVHLDMLHMARRKDCVSVWGKHWALRLSEVTYIFLLNDISALNYNNT
jgi:hypothetical protein